MGKGITQVPKLGVAQKSWFKIVEVKFAKVSHNDRTEGWWAPWVAILALPYWRPRNLRIEARTWSVPCFLPRGRRSRLVVLPLTGLCALGVIDLEVCEAGPGVPETVAVCAVGAAALLLATCIVHKMTQEVPAGSPSGRSWSSCAGPIPTPERAQCRILRNTIVPFEHSVEHIVPCLLSRRRRSSLMELIFLCSRR